MSRSRRPSAGLAGGLDRSLVRARCGCPLWALAPVIALVLSGCGVLAPLARECPGEFDFVAARSSESKFPTEFRFFRGGELVGRVGARVQGVPLNASAIALDRDRLVFVSSGNTVRDQTNIGTVDLGSCRVETHKVDAVAPYSMAVFDGGVLLGYWLNGVGRVRKFDSAGTLLGEYVAGSGLPVALTVAGDRVFAFVKDMDESRTELRVLRLDSMAQVARVELDSGSVEGAVVWAGRLWFAAASQSDDSFTAPPSDKLGVVGLDDLTVRWLRLPSDVPYQVAAGPDGVFVAHTFMNQAFGPFSQFHNVSRVDPASETVTSIEVSPGLRQVAVGEAGLFTAHHDDNGGTWVERRSLDRPSDPPTYRVLVDDRSDRAWYVAAIAAGSAARIGDI